MVVDKDVTHVEGVSRDRSSPREDEEDVAGGWGELDEGMGML